MISSAAADFAEKLLRVWDALKLLKIARLSLDASNAHKASVLNIKILKFYMPNIESTPTTDLPNAKKN